LPTINIYDKSQTDNLLSNKQDTLVSGTNIKTINGESVLGSGNIVISGGGSEIPSTPETRNINSEEWFTEFFDIEQITQTVYKIKVKKKFVICTVKGYASSGTYELGNTYKLFSKDEVYIGIRGSTNTYTNIIFQIPIGNNFSTSSSSVQHSVFLRVEYRYSTSTTEITFNSLTVRASSVTYGQRYAESNIVQNNFIVYI